MSENLPFEQTIKNKLLYEGYSDKQIRAFAAYIIKEMPRPVAMHAFGGNGDGSVVVMSDGSTHARYYANSAWQKTETIPGTLAAVVEGQDE